MLKPTLDWVLKLISKKKFIQTNFLRITLSSPHTVITHQDKIQLETMANKVVYISIT